MRGPYRPEFAVWSPDDWAGPRAAFVEAELHGGPPESSAIVLQYQQAVSGADVESVTLDVAGMSLDVEVKKGEVRLAIGLSVEGAVALRDILARTILDYHAMSEEHKR